MTNEQILRLELKAVALTSQRDRMQEENTQLAVELGVLNVKLQAEQKRSAELEQQLAEARETIERLNGAREVQGSTCSPT